MNTFRLSGLATVRTAVATVRTAVAAMVGGVCLFAIAAGDARAWEIDFENLGSGATVNNQYGTVGAITGAGFGTTAIFSGLDQAGGASSVQTLDTAAEPNKSDFRGPFAKSDDDTNLLDPGHVLVLAGQGPGSIVIEFSRGTAVMGMTFFDIDPKEVSTLNESNEIQFFDVSGNQIMDNAFYTPQTGNKRWENFYSPVYNVKKVVINLAGSGAIDKIVGTEIPEPGAAGLMIFGLTMLAWLRRRRSLSAA